MKRVICFDLWGTLVTSDMSRTYEDVLAAYWPREVIRETVRELLMTDAWVRHPLREHDGQGILRPNNWRTSDMLLTRLLKISPSRKHVYLSECHDWNSFDKSATEFAELLMQTAFYWEWENQQVKWINGAQEIVKSLKDRGETLALVTNTTSYGDAMVDRALELDRPRGRLFSAVFNSCAHPFAKPAPRVWKWLMEQFPGMDKYWMIGNDPAADITVPASMGWKTILVNHPEGVPITEVSNIIAGGGK